jgi:hypothetical protein
MANRYFSQFVWTLEKNPVVLLARVTIGASGAPTLDTTKSKGVKSITRTSAGLYVITFGVPSGATDTYNSLLFSDVRVLNSGGMAAPISFVKAQAVATAGTVTVQFLAIDNTTATDPGNGEELKFLFVLKNSTAQ